MFNASFGLGVPTLQKHLSHLNIFTGHMHGPAHPHGSVGLKREPHHHGTNNHVPKYPSQAHKWMAPRHINDFLLKHPTLHASPSTAEEHAVLGGPALRGSAEALATSRRRSRGVSPGRRRARRIRRGGAKPETERIEILRGFIAGTSSW